MKYSFSYHTPIGLIWIAEENGVITDLSFSPKNNTENLETTLIRRAAKQLTEYFQGSRTTFDLPLQPHGTPFQLAVWNALRDIPYGETRSYKDIAITIGNVKACRAVGMANNKNPISIIIPCHRVIGADGSLVGYGGGLDIKKSLLSLERKLEYFVE
jgi:methylated-DNA-[protein]-cysteine S-methyltransferase